MESGNDGIIILRDIVCFSRSVNRSFDPSSLSVWLLSNLSVSTHQFICFGLLVRPCVSVLLCFLALLVRAFSLKLLRLFHILQKVVATPPCPLALNKENFAEVDS